MPDPVKLSAAVFKSDGNVDSSKVEILPEIGVGTFLSHDSKKIGKLVEIRTVFFNPSYMVCVRVEEPPAGNDWGEGGAELDVAGAQARMASAKSDFETIENTKFVVSFAEAVEE